MAEVPVLGTTMHVEDVGEGRPVLLVHGNPTSSFLWRHVIRRRPPGWRCVAPDLVGMGRSGKPDIDYRFSDHAAHLDALLDELELDDLVVVGHDWGVALALDRLRRFPSRVRAVALMEGHVRPLPGWEAFDPGGRDLFQRLRTRGEGERLVLEENFFVETLLPAALTRALPREELARYQEPYPTPASRRPLLRWPREIPVGGEPEDMADRLTEAVEHATRSAVPKLLVHAPGTPIVTPDVVTWCSPTCRS